MSDAKAAFKEKIQRPGVYILLDVDDTVSDRRRAYIGESEEVCGPRGRLEYYLNRDDKEDGKPFWEDTIVLASKDENLTKSHVRYVESHLIAARGNPRWEGKQNQPSGNAGQLPEPDRCDMNKFVKEAKMLVGVLGCDLFRPVRSPDGEGGEDKEGAVGGAVSSPTFCFKGKGFRAKMRLSKSGRFLVMSGSLAKMEEAPTLSESAKKIRKSMLRERDLREENGSLVFPKDYSFPSVSSAAEVVSGSTWSGRTAWKLDDGRTYGEWETAKSEAADGSEDS